TLGGGGAGNGAFGGAGNVIVTGGTLTLAGTAQNLTIAGGTVNGVVNSSITNLTWTSGFVQGTNTLTGLGSWTGGQINGGGSTFTIASTATINISGSSSETLYGVL